MNIIIYKYQALYLKLIFFSDSTVMKQKNIKMVQMGLDFCADG